MPEATATLCGLLSGSILTRRAGVRFGLSRAGVSVSFIGEVGLRRLNVPGGGL